MLKYTLKNSRGQSLVEFALALPILLLIVIGIIQFGIVWYSQVTITSASREGARMASVGDNDDIIKSRVNSITFGIPFLYVDVETDISIEPDPKIVGQEVRVTVSGEVDVIIPFIDFFLSQDKFRIYSQTAMRYQSN